MSEPPTPDRLAEGERLPESETAFGLPIPNGMRLARHFSDAAYFTGDVPMERVLEQITPFIEARDAQMMSRRVVYGRTRVKDDESNRVLRIEVAATPRGSQLHVKDVTPPPAARLATEEERWRRAGRNPDGTPIDQNKLY